MQRIGLVAALVVASILTSPSGRAASPAEEVVKSEREFAAAALADGVRAAFLRYMAEDGIVFRPGPVNARDWYRDLPESDVTLRWQPTFAGASAAGDLGFTTGPWVLTRPDPESAPLHGHYISVWRVQPDGPWRVVLDVGISHSDPGASGELVYLEQGVSAAAESPPGESDELAAAEGRLCRSTRNAGPVAAYRESADESLRLYVGGSLPHVGKAAALQILASFDPASSCEPPNVEISRSSDLGYAFHVDDSGGGFVRLWRHGEAGWRVVVVVLLPAPPDKDPS